MGLIAGIIPGNRGAVTVLNADGSILRAWTIPNSSVQTHNGARYHLDAAAFTARLAKERIDNVVVERVASMERPEGAFSIGFACGIIEGVLAATGLQRHSISHREWRSDLSIPDDYWDAVERVNALTRRHWPAKRFDASFGGHRKQLAALLALYGAQMSHHQALAA